MTILVKRDTLHQLIDDLPEHQLLEVARFVEFLLFKESHNASNFELWGAAADRGLASAQEEPSGDDSDDLSKLMRIIKNTPANTQAITLPTKSWADYAAEISLEADEAFDVTTWNRTWDALEAEMEASSLAHEEFERQEKE